MSIYEPIPGHRLITAQATAGGRTFPMTQCSCEGNRGLPKQQRDSWEAAIEAHDRHCDEVRRGEEVGDE